MTSDIRIKSWSYDVEFVWEIIYRNKKNNETSPCLLCNSFLECHCLSLHVSAPCWPSVEPHHWAVRWFVGFPQLGEGSLDSHLLRHLQSRHKHFGGVRSGRDDLFHLFTSVLLVRLFVLCQHRPEQTQWRSEENNVNRTNTRLRCWCLITHLSTQKLCPDFAPP